MPRARVAAAATAPMMPVRMSSAGWAPNAAARNPPVGLVAEPAVNWRIQRRNRVIR